MSLCAACGLQLDGANDFCPHHLGGHGEDWAAANRIMCDFFHRGKIPTRLPPAERDENFVEPAPARAA